MKKFITLTLLFLLTTAATTNNNIKYISKVVYGESGANYRDCWYVAQVIKNRIDNKWTTMEKVVKAKGQFNGFKTIKNQQVKDSIECIIYHVINDNIPDSLRLPEGTKYFCNPKGVKNKRAKRWFNTREKVLISVFRKGVEHHYYR